MDTLRHILEVGEKLASEIIEYSWVDENGKTIYSDQPKLDEVSPPGWKGTSESMKKHKKITNPWALSWYMKGKGAESHVKEKD